jgi:VCBS repeat-containing protein
VTQSPGTTTFTENGAPVPVDAQLTVTDPDSTLKLAVVAINNAQAGDTVTWTPPAGSTITVHPTATSPTVLVLVGDATAAEYQSALRAVTFSNTSENPSTAPRSMMIRVFDGANEVTVYKPANVTAVNDAPIANPTTPAPNANHQVVGTVGAIDPEGDALTYTMLTPTTFEGGSATVASDGTYTYTPGSAARINAAGTPAIDRDYMTVRVTDAHGAFVDVTIRPTIDPAVDNEIVDAITVGGTPTDVVLNNGGTRAYVANANGTVSVIDTATNPLGSPSTPTVVGTITLPAGQVPEAMALSQGGTRLYVATKPASGTGAGQVSAYDAQTYTQIDTNPSTPGVVDSITVANGNQPTALAIGGPGDNFLYVANRNPSNGNGQVSVYELTNFSQVDVVPGGPVTSINVGRNPSALAVNGALFVTSTTSTGGAEVWVINTGSNAIVDQVPGGAPSPLSLPGATNPTAIATDINGSRMYVSTTDAVTGGGQVWVINPANAFAFPVTIVDQVPGGAPQPISVASVPTGIAVKGSTLFVTYSDGTMSRIDTANNNSVTPITVVPTPPGGGLTGVGVRTTSSANRVYVTGNDGKVYVIAIVPTVTAL